MPIRLFKPGFRTSEKVNSCSLLAQLTYVRLITIVDDFGRYLANPRLLRSELWPLGDDRGADIPLEAFVTALQQLATPQKGVGDEGPLIILYTVGGTQYVQMGNWTEKARASTSKYPEPPKVAQQVHGSCKADAKQMITSPSPSPSPSPYSDSIPPSEPDLPQREPDYPELPNWEAVKAHAARIGLVEWKALDWFNEMEGCGWLDYHKRQIRKWSSVLDRVRTRWEADGRPMKQPGIKSPQTEIKTSPGVTSFVQHKELERVSERMKTIKATYSGHQTWAEDDIEEFRKLRDRKNELKAILGVKL